MRYVFRHLPVAGNENAIRAAELAEYAAQTSGPFWEVHEVLMERGPAFSEVDFQQIPRDFHLPQPDAARQPALAAAQTKVREDIESAEAQRVASDADVLHQRPTLRGRLG
jgi:NhaA family Na+:H+ antiporter